MIDDIFDDEDEAAENAAELSEDEARNKRYEEEAAQKLTRGGGLDDDMPRLAKGKIVGTVAAAIVLLCGGGLAWAKTRAKDQVSEREVIRRDLKPAPVPEVFKKLGQSEPDDVYAAVDPKDPAFTTPITALPPEPVKHDEDYIIEHCPAEYTPAECVALEAAKMKAEGDPQGRGPKYMGSSYAANAGKKGSHVVNADWEDEGLAPMTYYPGANAARQPSLTAVAPPADVPMSLPAQGGLQLPPNLRQALEHAAQQQGAQDGDDVKEAFAARPGVLDAEDDERELAECELTAGTVIHVANLTAINTDIPGKSSVTAQVTQTIYCGSDNQHVAIPQGSTFTASANARVAYGDNRIQLCMEQLRRPPSRAKPNGSILTTKCWGAADITGMLGWDGDVDNHWPEVIAAVTLSAVLSMGTSATAGNQEGFAPTIAQRAANQAGTQLNQAGQRIVQRDLARKPTITRNMLQSGTVIVTENKPIAPWRARKAKGRAW